jgi:DNA-binding IclR family transcriptional regulator
MERELLRQLAHRARFVAPEEVRRALGVTPSCFDNVLNMLIRDGCVRSDVDTRHLPSGGLTAITRIAITPVGQKALETL